MEVSYNIIISYWLKDQCIMTKVHNTRSYAVLPGRTARVMWLERYDWKSVAMEILLKLNLLFRALVWCWIKRKPGDCKDQRTVRREENLNERWEELTSKCRNKLPVISPGVLWELWEQPNHNGRMGCDALSEETINYKTASNMSLSMFKGEYFLHMKCALQMLSV